MSGYLRSSRFSSIDQQVDKTKPDYLTVFTILFVLPERKITVCAFPVTRKKNHFHSQPQIFVCITSRTEKMNGNCLVFTNVQFPFQTDEKKITINITSKKLSVRCIPEFSPGTFDFCCLIGYLKSEVSGFERPFTLFVNESQVISRQC
ncbi:MAG: hypothetical protein H6Q19_2133 [Bacteroidetes bacterium]|nr:hypothetical protein [Bacteroidota bacterium]